MKQTTPAMKLMTACDELSRFHKSDQSSNFAQYKCSKDNILDKGITLDEIMKCAREQARALDDTGRKL